MTDVDPIRAAYAQSAGLLRGALRQAIGALIFHEPDLARRLQNVQDEAAAVIDMAWQQAEIDALLVAAGGEEVRS